MSADKIPQSVIVIDNDQLVQSMIRGYLTKVGTTKIVQCRNGQEAQQAFQKDKFDLIIMDWKLKQPTGPEMFKALKTNPDTVMVPLILTSGQFTKNDAAIFKKFPGTSFIMKPFSEDALLMTVSKTHPGAHPKKVKEREKKKNSFAARLAAAQAAAKNKQNGAKQIAAPTGTKSTNEKEEMFHLKGGGGNGNNADLQSFGSGGASGSGMFVAKGSGQAGLGLMHDQKDQMLGGNGTFVDKREPGATGNGLQTFTLGDTSGGSEVDSGNIKIDRSSGWGGQEVEAKSAADESYDGPTGWGESNDLKLEAPTEGPSGFDLTIKNEDHTSGDIGEEQRFTGGFQIDTNDGESTPAADMREQKKRDEEEFAAAMKRAQATMNSGATNNQQSAPWNPGETNGAQQQNSNPFDFSNEASPQADAEAESNMPKGNAFAGLFAELEQTKQKPSTGIAKKIIPMFGRTNPFAAPAPAGGESQPEPLVPPTFDLNTTSAASNSSDEQQQQNPEQGAMGTHEHSWNPSANQAGPTQHESPSLTGWGERSDTNGSGNAQDVMQDPLGASTPNSFQPVTNAAPKDGAAESSNQPSPTSNDFGFSEMTSPRPQQNPSSEGAGFTLNTESAVASDQNNPNMTGSNQGTSELSQQHSDSLDIKAPVAEDASDILDANASAPTAAVGRTLSIGQKRLRTALIVERDISLRRIVEKYLGEMGLNRVIAFGDGMEAWNKFAAENFDMVLLDWKAPTLSGLAFYNRLRKDKAKFATPIVITCGFVKKQDFRVFEDNPCVSFIEKPFQLPTLDKGITQLVTQVTEYNALIKDVATYLQAPENTSRPLVAQMEGLLKKFTNPVPALLASGQFLFSKQRWDDAEKVFKLAFSIDKKNVSTLTWLGKVYHKLNRVDEALRILQKAEGLSPENIERLCLLGEVGISLKDPAKAKSYFQKAMVIDKDDQKAKAGIVLADNLQDYMSSYQGTEEVANKFSSVLNIVGITYVRNKQYDKGVTQYHAAMSFTDDDATLARLEFNLGLAYLRSKKFDEAKKWFGKAKITGGPEYIKPGEYLQKIDTYLASARVDLINGNKPIEMVEIDEEEIFAA